MRALILLSGGATATGLFLRILSTASAQMPPPTTAYPSWSTAVNFSPDGRYAVAYGTIKDLETDMSTMLPGAQRLAFTADGKRLYGMCEDQTLKCWDTDG